MFRKLALVGIFAVSLAGCRDDSNPLPVDLSHGPYDMAVNPNADLSMMQMMMSTTAHDIDTNAVSAGTAVSLTGMISVTSVHRHLSSTTMYCEYRTIVQDATCSSPPCGIELYQRGQKLTTAGATTKDCPYADAAGSMTVLGQIKNYGDVVTVGGSVKSFPDQMAPMTVVLHSLSVDTLTVTTTKGPLPTPIAITDTATSMFTAHSGSGWNMYEGTYIKLSPNGGGKFTVGTQDTFYDYTVTPGGAEYDTNNYFGPKDAGTFPMPGATYSSISGVVDNDFGGTISPILPGDFAP
jgi:hypothetical protein